MPAIRIENERLVLRSLAYDAANASASLGDTIQAAAFGKVASVLDGKALIRASAAGTSVDYVLPTGEAHPQDVSAMLERLLTRYETAVAALGLPTSLGTTDDALILAYMLSQMTVVRSYGKDHSVPNFRP